MNNIHEIDLNSEARPEKMPLQKTDLNVFRPVYRWDTWPGFWSNIKYFFLAIGQMLQRGTKGYCDWDIPNCGYNIFDYMVNVLIEFRNRTCSWPDYEYETYGQWIAEIDEVIDKLDFARQEPDEFNTYAEEFDRVMDIPYEQRTDEDREIISAYFAENAMIHDIQQKAAEKAFTWIGKHAKDLWS
jgi:hypothetical protein